MWTEGVSWQDSELIHYLTHSLATKYKKLANPADIFVHSSSVPQPIFIGIGIQELQYPCFTVVVLGIAIQA